MADGSSSWHLYERWEFNGTSFMANGSSRHIFMAGGVSTSRFMADGGLASFI